MKRIILFAIIGGTALGAAYMVIFCRDWCKAVFYIHDMETEERVARLQVKRVVDMLSLEKGDTVADIGAGTGLFSMAMAKRTGPEGKVYAVDINRSLLDHVEKKALQAGIGNIVPVEATEDDPGIPAPVDLIFMCDTFHYVALKSAYLTCLRKHLKPGGRLVIIDLKDKWPPFHDSYRFTVDELKKWAAAAGFRLVQEYDFLSEEFFVVFELD